MSGTDTYWLSKPLRVGFQHKHSLLIDGSVNNEKAEKEEFGNIRYSVNLAFGQNNGVMKGSGRTTYEAGTKLLYNSKNYISPTTCNSAWSIATNLLMAIFRVIRKPFPIIGKRCRRKILPHPIACQRSPRRYEPVYSGTTRIARL